jgi:hypothetical protein
MLSCIYLAGTLFMMNTDRSEIHNFHHFTEFDVIRSTFYATSYSESARYTLPDHLSNASPVEVINTCVEQAEIAARHAEQTSLSE